MNRDVSGFEFRGNAKEWFGIWIVNLLLSIVTLGIYSAWAKVRRHKYFYNNTYVEGRNFDYHATGGQILVGRLIVVGVFVLYNLLMTMLPVLGLIVALGIFVMMPWLIVRAMMFNARMTSFSNVRFNFSGTAGQAAKVYILYPLLCMLTLYLTFPLLERAMSRFSIDNHRLGTAAFKLNAPLAPFYKAFFAAAAFAAVGIAAVIFTAMPVLEAVAIGRDPEPEVVLTMMLSIYAVFFLTFLPAAVVYQAMVRNAVFNNTVLEGGHRFSSDVSALRLLWIAFSNLFAVACTLGLMLPWAQIRMARYLSAHTGVTAGSSVDAFADEQRAKTSAVGDAFADFEGIDVGLPV